MGTCPLCASDLSDEQFHAVLLEERHGIGEPPGDSTNWIALKRTLSEEYGIEVTVPELMAHADEHIAYM